MLTLGIDLGTSFVKAAVLDVHTGNCVASAQFPDKENPILTLQQGWAEQSPDLWWEQVLAVLDRLNRSRSFDPAQIAAIGISYQMHGLVCLDEKGVVLRNSIIWCDSRAVPYGEEAFQKMGAQRSLDHLLNSPGNFTAAKLSWVKKNEPELYGRIDKVMLPGDFIAYRLTGQLSVTPSSLSEGIFWDFRADKLSEDVMNVFGFEERLIPPVREVFSTHGTLSREIASRTGMKEGIPVSYKSGDQPNNAFSLNVLQPGEIAATAGTSGVVYGVMDRVSYDPLSRVNSFVHVNHTPEQKRIGVLLCVNGTGILNSWLKNQFFTGMSYEEVNAMAGTAPIGSSGLQFYPFGNGAERVLQNRDAGASLKNLHFNKHTAAHVARAAQEGIVFALKYGIGIMENMGLRLSTVRAGKANLFLSPLFAQAFSNAVGCRLELFNTDGALGAARGAGKGAGIFSSDKECFRGMDCLQAYEPSKELSADYEEAYQAWVTNMDQ